MVAARTANLNLLYRSRRIILYRFLHRASTILMIWIHITLDVVHWTGQQKSEQLSFSSSGLTPSRISRDAAVSASKYTGAKTRPPK